MLDIQKKLKNSFFVLLSLPATAMGFALSIQISALSWIMSYKYHLAIEDVGIVWAAGPLAGIFGQVIVGIISDNVWFLGGRRRPFVLIGGTIAAVMLLALPNLHLIQNTLGITNILVLAIMVAMSLDIAINISFNPTRSIITDVTPEGDSRTKGYAWMQTISGSFGFLAYLIGVFIGKELLIYLGAALVFIFSFIPMFLIEESKELKDDSSSEEIPKKKIGLGEILRTIIPLLGYVPFAIYYFVLKLSEVDISSLSYNNYILLGFIIFQLALTAVTLFRNTDSLPKEERNKMEFRKVLAAHSFSWVGIQTMFVFTFAFLSQVFYGGVTELTEAAQHEIGQHIDYMFAIFNLVGFLLPKFVLEPIAHKYGRINVHLGSVAIMSIAYLLIAFIGTSAVSIYLMMAFAGIGWGAVVSFPFAIMSEKISKSQIGLYMGIFNLSVVLPQLIVSLGIGSLIQIAADKNLVYIIAGVTTGISALAWYFVKDSKK